MCATNEECEDDEEDQESLEKADMLFQSMMMKGVNQSEELLLEMSSFHSEQESIDLSEKCVKDESFKLSSHAFNAV